MKYREGSQGAAAVRDADRAAPGSAERARTCPYAPATDPASDGGSSGDHDARVTCTSRGLQLSGDPETACKRDHSRRAAATERPPARCANAPSADDGERERGERRWPDGGAVGLEVGRRCCITATTAAMAAPTVARVTQAGGARTQSGSIHRRRNRWVVTAARTPSATHTTSAAIVAIREASSPAKIATSTQHDARPPGSRSAPTSRVEGGGPVGLAVLRPDRRRLGSAAGATTAAAPPAGGTAGSAVAGGHVVAPGSGSLPLTSAVSHRLRLTAAP